VLENAGELLEKLLVPVAGSGEMLSYMASILEYLDGVLERWDREFICQYHQRVKRLQNLNIPMETRTCLKLVDQLCNGIVVPFKGEPLKGLQIMGTLETRALDFDNVIIVSANEGKFPSSNVGNSIIPYNLRVGFGLPTYELQDGIAAYHFYRSISRAKNIYMIYDTRSEGLSSGEVSRYVKQLKFHFGVDMKELAVSVPPVIVQGDEGIKVEKKGEVMEKLLQMYTGDGVKSLSASALNNYISCPLKFYVENVEGMADEEEVAETVESNVFGSIFHYVMENIYKKYEGKKVHREDIVREKNDHENIGKLILQGFVEYMHTDALEGQHKIIEALLRKYISLALETDIKAVANAPLLYVAGERRFRYRLPINGGDLHVNFKAFIDRIDTLVEGNITRIIDYKTGSVTPPDSKFELSQLFDKEGDGKYKALAQLYLYALIMFDEKLVKGEKVEDALLTVYQLKKIAREEPMQKLLVHEDLVEYKRLLTECVEEIFNEEIPFYPNPQEKNCGYCKLQAVCRK
jgi:RecB family exonuclease